MVELIIAMPTLYHFGDWEYDPSGTGIDTKSLVGGASSPCT